VSLGLPRVSSRTSTRPRLVWTYPASKEF